MPFPQKVFCVPPLGLSQPLTPSSGPMRTEVVLCGCVAPRLEVPGEHQLCPQAGIDRLNSPLGPALAI